MTTDVPTLGAASARDQASTPGRADAVPRGSDDAAPRGSDYALLSREVKRAGLLARRPGYYTVKIVSNLVLLTAGWAAFAFIGPPWWQLLGAVFLAVTFTQTAFLGHDAGHQQISGSKRVNELLGRLHGNLLVGLSYGWWISKHNRHHAHPNQVDRDPDIATGAKRLHPRERPGPQGSRCPARPPAGLAVLPDAAPGGTPPARRGSPRPVRRQGHRTQVRQGPLSRNDKTAFLRRQILTARNIRGGRITDFAFGGLNYQIEHHLFPSMPRPNLRHAQTLVRAFSRRHGVAYCETGLLRSYAQVLRHLHAVGGPLRPELEY